MSVKAHELTEHPEFWAAEINKMNSEIDRLRARLAEIEGQEPVAWRFKFPGMDWQYTDDPDLSKRGIPKISASRAIVEPIYADKVPAECECCGYVGHDLSKYRKLLQDAAPVPAIPPIQSPELALLIREVIRSNPAVKETRLSMLIAIAVSEAWRKASPRRGVKPLRASDTGGAEGGSGIRD